MLFRSDRRIMALATEAAGALLVAVLLVNALLPHPQVWVLYVAAMLLAAVDGLQRPSVDAMIPRVVAHDQMPAASALTSLRWTFASITGPALGGILISAVGPWSAYAVDVASYVLSIALLWRLPSIRAAVTESASLRHVMAGLRYAMSRRDLLGTYAIDLIEIGRAHV